MTKYLYAGSAADYPTLGFSVAGSGAILDGAASTPAIASPPDARWSVYGGVDPESGITRYASPSGPTSPPEPSDGFILRYSDAGNSYVASSPAEFAALTPVADALEAAASGAVSSELDATLDDRSATLIETPASQVATALAATVAGVATPIAATEAAKVAQPPVEGFLGKIAKAKTGVFRIASYGTSIQTFDSAPWAVLAETLKTIYGSTNLDTQRAGLFSGSTTAPFLGWNKQRYSGPFLIRSRGDSASSDLRFTVGGDTIDLFFSREADSEAANIEIDGVVVGTTPAAGSQQYGVRQTYTVAPGPHVLTFKPPTGSGYVYLERFDCYDAARKGVEVLDFTLGGSTLAAYVATPAGSGGQVTTIPVVGDNGVNAMTSIPNLDAVHIGYTVNDAGLSPFGTGPTDAASSFQLYFVPTMNKLVAATAALRIPLLITIEMAGHYIMPNDNGSGQRYAQYNAIAAFLRSLKVNNHVTVLDHDAATRMADITAYAERYYDAGTVNVAAGTSTGDFIHALETKPGPRIGSDLLHKQMGLPSPRFPLASGVRKERRLRLRADEGRDVKVTIAGSTKKYPTAAGVAYQATSTSQFTRVPYMRDPSPTDLATAWAASLASPTGTDEWGAYKDMTTVSQTLPGSVSWSGGATRLIVIRGSGIALRAAGVSRLLDPNGVAMPLTDVSGGRTRVAVPNPSSGAEPIAGEEPIVLAVRVGASTTGGTLDLTGRIYEAVIIDSDVPILTKDAAAGAQGVPGATGPAGGYASVVSSTEWSSCTVPGNLSTGVPALNDESMVQFVPLNDCSIDKLAAEVTTVGAAGSVMRLGIRQSDAAHKPSTLIAECTTTGDCTSIGSKELTLPAPVALLAGQTYWLTCAIQGATATLRLVQATLNPMVSTATSGGAGAANYYKGGTTGALGTSGTPSGVRSASPRIQAHVV